jgi:hypothetical protein
MKIWIPSIVLLVFSLCAGGAFAQNPDASTEETPIEPTPPVPVAFVYVANLTNPGGIQYVNNTYGFVALPSGALIPIAGSPFKDDLESFVANGKYLFGTDEGTGNIDGFLMEANGALKKVSTTNPLLENPGGCPNLVWPRIDHSGKVLYNPVSTADSNCMGTKFQYFEINEMTGKLEYEGAVSDPDVNEDPFYLSFLGNNEFAYAPYCYLLGNQAFGGIQGFHRLSNGDLHELNLGALGPKPPQSGNFYCPSLAATDPSDHLAVLLEDTDSSGNGVGLPVIATYTTDANGNLSTSSTPQNMPSIAPNQGNTQMRMSPSGKLLAVAGTGLQIFHFNGANPVTPYKILLPGANIFQVSWDNNNHLYAVEWDYTPGTGLLHVYNATPSTMTEAPGSPYSIPNPINVTVQPR